MTAKPSAVLACGTLSYRQQPLERALEGIVRAGFQAVELGCVCGYCEHVVPEKMTPGEMDALAAQVARHGLRIASIAGHIDLACPLLGKGAAAAAEGFRRLRARIDLAERLGVPIVNTGVGVAGADDDMNAFLSEFRRLLGYAGQHGVKIGVESHAGVSETAAASLAFCRQVNHPALGINHDAGNVRFYAGQDPVTDLESVADEIGEWLVHVHIKDHRGGKGDWDFPPLGEGDLDLKALAVLYRRIGFAGPYSLEIDFRGPDSSDPTPAIIDQGVSDSFRYMTDLGLGSTITLEQILDQPGCATAAADLKGNAFVFRPLAEDDAQRLADYFAGLSPRTRGWFAPHKFDAATAQALCRERESEQTLRMAAVTGAPPAIAAYFLLQFGVRDADAGRFAGYGMPLDNATDCTLAPSVGDAFQGVGLGSAMLRHVTAVARRAGKTRMVLFGGVNADNRGAVHFYEKFGFRTVAMFGTTMRKHDMIMDLIR